MSGNEANNNQKTRFDKAEWLLVCSFCVLVGSLGGSIWQSNVDKKVQQRSQQSKTVRTDDYFEGLRYRSNGSGDFERRNQTDTVTVLWCVEHGNVFDVCAVNSVDPQKHVATFDEKTNPLLKGTRSGDSLVVHDGVPVKNVRLARIEQEAIKGK